MNRPVLAVAFAIFSSLLAGQSISPPFARVGVGSDGLAHIVNSSGQDSPIGEMNGQVGVDSPRLSADKLMAGWMVLQNNCCTSYPVTTSVAISNGKETIYLHDEKMVVGWCFVPGKRQVVVATETVHGWSMTASPDIRLYSALSGRVLQRWSRDPDSARPLWASCLKK